MSVSTEPQGTIFDIKRYAIHDGPGIRTTVFFKGCPLDCWWCHNPESRSPDIETIIVKSGGENGRQSRQETVGRCVTVEQVMAEVSKDRIFYEQSGGGITLSGGEPMMQTPFAATLLEACREQSIMTALDTSGFASAEDFAALDGLVDLYLYDLKLMDDDAHTGYTGVSNVPILENLRCLTTAGQRITVRIPLIPGITDTDDNLAAIAEFLTPLKSIQTISLLPYNLLATDKCRRFGVVNRLGDVSTQSPNELNRHKSRFESYGYHVRIGG
jgi:pyruvate formate lyase activating enzyme